MPVLEKVARRHELARWAPNRRAHGRGGSPRGVLVVMCAGYFLVLLDVTIVNVALPRIGTGIHAGVSGLQWVVDAYALALASLMLAGGAIGDLRGHKRIVLAGLVVFGVGSLACGLAPTVAVLLGARVLQGVGAAMLLPGTLAIISHAFADRQERARAIGVWAGIGSLALPAGPLLGGLLVAALGWRAVFLVNVPIVVVALVAAALIVTETTEPQTRRLDVYGVVLGILTLLAVVFAFIQGGRSGAGSTSVIAAALAAVALGAAFFAVEHHRGSEAMLPLALFRRPGFTIANAAAGVMNLCTLGTIFVLTLFLQSIQHRTPLIAGVMVIPLFAPLAIVAPIAGRLTSRIGSRLPIVAGLCIAAVGLALLMPADEHSRYPSLLAPFLLWGIGLGILTPALVSAAIAAVPASRSGLASAINNTARQTGGAIGIAVAGAVTGPPANQQSFVNGFHAVALGAAILYLITAALAFALVPGKVVPRG